MGERADEWQQTVEPHLGFLAEFGFKVTATDDSSSWSTSVTYTSAVAGIHVGRSMEFNRSEVHLIRLVDGAVPPYPLFITAEPIAWVLLDTVLDARSPDRAAKVEALTGLGDAEIDLQLVFWAESLQAVASDFLHGDLKAMDEADRLLRQS